MPPVAYFCIAPSHATALGFRPGTQRLRRIEGAQRRNMDSDRPPSPTYTLVRRELLLLARNPQLFGAMTALATLLAFTAFVILPWGNGTNASMAAFSQSTFRTQFFLLYTAALTIMPTLAAAAVVHERNQECFPLIYISLIPPGWIVWSKFIALMSLYGLVYAGILPFTGLIYFFAGVEQLSLIQGALVSFSLAAGTASIGLLASALARDHSRAVYLTMLGVAIMFLFPWSVQATLGLAGQPTWGWLDWIGPVNAYNTVFSGLPDWRPTLGFAAYQASIALGALTLARHQILPRRDDDVMGVRYSVTRWIPQRRARRFSSFPDGINPVAIKDYRGSSFARGLTPWLLGVLGVCTGSYGYFNTYSAWSILGLSLDSFVLVALLPPLMTSLVMAERGQDMLISLRMTALTANEISLGKITAGVQILRPLVLGAIIGKGIIYAGLAVGIVPSFPVPGGWNHLNPLPLMAGTAELLINMYIFPRLSLRGAVSQSGPLAATFSSYISIFVALSFASIVAGALSTPFLMEGMVYLWPWVHLTVKFGILLFFAGAALDGAVCYMASRLYPP